MNPLPKNIDAFHAPLCPGGPINDGPCACPVAIAKELHKKVSDYEKALTEIVKLYDFSNPDSQDCEMYRIAKEALNS